MKVKHIISKVCSLALAALVVWCTAVCLPRAEAAVEAAGHDTCDVRQYFVEAADSFQCAAVESSSPVCKPLQSQTMKGGSPFSPAAPVCGETVVGGMFRCILREAMAFYVPSFASKHTTYYIYTLCKLLM